jgi:drug/metabolite transporter (DMT)-like permease
VVPEGILFGATAAVSWGTADYVTARLARRASPLAVLLAAHVAGLVVMTAVLAVALDAPAISGGQWAGMLALGPFSVLTYLALFRALQHGPLAIVSPVVAAWAIVTLALGLTILGEPLAGHEAAGAALILGGVLLASTRAPARAPDVAVASAAPARRGVLFALGAMLGLGVYNFCLGDLAQDIGWFAPLYVSRAAGVVLMCVVVARSGDWPWRQLAAGPLAVAALLPGVLATVGTLAFSRGAELGHVALTAAAASFYPVIPIATGVVLLGERLVARQLAGIVGIVVGLVVLSAAG